MLRKLDAAYGKGELFLTGMLGRDSSLDADMEELQNKAVDYVVSLTSLEEIREKSPRYALSLESGEFHIRRCEFPIPDFGVPGRPEDFLDLVRQVSRDIRDGSRVAIHCAGGIGRTGTMATCVLLALDHPVPSALKHVHAAGSYPETDAQMKLVNWVSERLSCAKLQ